MTDYRRAIRNEVESLKQRIIELTKMEMELDRLSNLSDPDATMPKKKYGGKGHKVSQGVMNAIFKYLETQSESVSSRDVINATLHLRRGEATIWSALRLMRDQGIVHYGDDRRYTLITATQTEDETDAA